MQPQQTNEEEEEDPFQSIYYNKPDPRQEAQGRKSVGITLMQKVKMVYEKTGKRDFNVQEVIEEEIKEPATPSKEEETKGVSGLGDDEFTTVRPLMTERK